MKKPLFTHHINTNNPSLKNEQLQFNSLFFCKKNTSTAHIHNINLTFKQLQQLSHIMLNGVRTLKPPTHTHQNPHHKTNLNILTIYNSTNRVPKC